MLKIVSGGQTGVDRGALDAALEAGVPCGGWCPPGCLAEDGVIDSRYGLKPLEQGGYADRTRRNVVDSDATLVIYFGRLEGGTALTASYCEQRCKPLLLVDALQSPPAMAAGRAVGFIAGHGVEKLNVAGPRASTTPAAYGYARSTIALLLDTLPQAVE